MEICPKCGAIAEYNAYYNRITCTRCNWESETMLKEEYKNSNTHDFDKEILKAARQPIQIIEPSYEYLRGFYDGIFCEQNQFELDYDYLKGFYEGVRVRKPKNG